MSRNISEARRAYQSLYQINTRVWLTELSRRLGRRATLDDIPEDALDRVAELGFVWVWFLGVWQTGPTGMRISRSNPEWRHEFAETLPDLEESDIAGSCFAITAYDVPAECGGDAALARLRQRLSRRGQRLMLDFVPNHTALDHPWTSRHPEYYVAGSDDQLRNEPQNYIRIDADGRERIIAYGRDPYFSGWPDTAQLNYADPGLQAAMREELLRIAARCDGVRCDMAMLILPEVFERTWGLRSAPFWPETIAEVKRRHPQFVLMAEVYWDLEWTLQQQGFDYTYDKRLYDRLRDGHAAPVRGHLHAGLDFQNRLARFLENHDEPRAAATFPPNEHQAAAIVTFLTPALRFIHDGQIEGRTRRISPHLVRAPMEPKNAELEKFYRRLLDLLKRAVVREGEWRLLDCRAAWEGNDSWDNFIAFEWRRGDERLLVAVNFAPHPSQCFVSIPAIAPEEGAVYRLQDSLSAARYEREAADLVTRGLYLDVGAWHYHVFELTQISAATDHKRRRETNRDRSTRGVERRAT
ncbi:MAG: alpha-amylase family glycosyl hydrolase [Sulfurifustis sp.]